MDWNKKLKEVDKSLDERSVAWANECHECPCCGNIVGMKVVAVCDTAEDYSKYIKEQEADNG